MDDLNVIDQFTQTFSTYIETGFGLVSGDVGFLLSILIAIDIVLAGLFWALMGEDNVLAQLIKKVLYIGFFALLLNNFSSLANIVFQSFAGLGLRASAAPFGPEQLMRPGFIADTGFTAAWPLLEAAGELMGFTSFFENFITIAVLLFAWLVVLLAFFILSVQLFITIIEFKLTTLAGFVLIPFALFGKTAFLAERVLGNIISSGIKLMVLAIVVGIGSTIFGDIATPPDGDIDLRHAASIILAAIAVFGLAIFIPGIAAGLVSGAPQLGAGAAAGTAAGLVGAGVAGGALVSGSGRALGNIGSSAVTTAASLSGRIGSAYQSGGATGVAKATIGRAASNAASSMSAPIRDAHAQGSAEGFRATSNSSSKPSNTGRGAGVASSFSHSGNQKSQTPAWAKQMNQGQRIREAGMIATHTLRDGDRGGAEGPKLDPDK